MTLPFIPLSSLYPLHFSPSCSLSPSLEVTQGGLWPQQVEREGTRKDGVKGEGKEGGREMAAAMPLTGNMWLSFGAGSGCCQERGRRNESTNDLSQTLSLQPIKLAPLNTKKQKDKRTPS